MARRGRGEGSIRRRADGRWEAVGTIGGQRRSFYGQSRAEAKEKLARAQRDFEQGALVGDPRQTVEQYLASWLESKRPPNVRWTTYRNYENTLRLHITPVIGRVKLQQLSAQHIQQVIAGCATHGLGPSSTKQVSIILRIALKAAVRLGLLAYNPADRVAHPRPQRFEIHPFSRDEAQRFIASVANHRFGLLFTLALSTGMRQSELLGLRWRDVDLEAGRVSVVYQLLSVGGLPTYTEPKSKSSRRQIALAPEMVAQLRAARHAQRLQRIAVGSAWQGDTYDAVFADELGFPLGRGRVGHQFNAAVASAGLPHRRFHDLRHTCATLLLQQRVNPKVVSEMLGHASVSITLDIYSHVLPDMQQEAAQAMSTALGW